MMITIHGLPPKTTFQAVKALVKQECNIIDFICDNLVDDGPNSRKVRIGVSDDAEGYRILKCLNGFRMSPTHLLKIVPVGKPLNPHPPQNYDQRPNFQNEAQDDYSNQSRPDYQNPPMDNYGRIVKDTRKGNYIPPNMRKKKLPQGADDLRTAGPLMPPEIHRQSLEQLHRERNSHSSGPHGIGTRGQDSRHPLVESQDMMNSPQWGPNRNSSNNEWAPPGQGMQGQNSYNQRPNQGGFGQQGHSQGLQDSYSQGRGPLSEGFGFQTKPTVSETVASTAARDTRQHVLRAVDIVDAQPPARQYAQEKPITIMKDNFQGPSHYGAASQQNYSGQGQPPVWSMTQQTKHQYDDRHPPIDKRPDAPKQDYEKRGHFIPMGSSRPISPSRPGISTTRSYQEPNRRISPTRQFPERRMSPNRLGPAVRDFSPSGRRVSPGRRFSPGRKMSPGRRMSPSDRRMSPGRRYSPGRKMSPGRKYSPGRKMSPGRRFSPGRKDDGRRMSPSEARRMGRRESPRRYSPTRRLASPVRQRFSPNRLGDKPADKFLDNKGQKPVRPAYELPQAQNQSYTGGYRDSAQYPTRQEQRPSPWQNDKIMFLSSIKDDDRRDIMRRADKPADKSPGRISRSPIKDRYRRHSPSPRSSRSPRRSWALEKRSPDPIREPPPPPVWPGQDPEPVIRQPKRFEPEPQETKHANVWERLDEARSFQDKIRVRTDLEDKFPPPRREFDDRRDYRDDVDRKQMDRDREFRRSADRNEFRRDSPRRDDRTTTKKVFSDIDKDFQDIYKRAVEFRKKTEERQKSGERRREEYEDRHKAEDRYRREESPRRSRSRERGEWKVKDRPRFFLSPNIKLKREKAIDEITNRIIDKYEIIGDQKIRVTDELRVTLANIFIEMFEDKDVSFIELVIKYQAKYPPNEEEKLFKEVLSRLPTHYRNLKRKSDGKDTSDIGTKSSRRSPPRANREGSKYVLKGSKYIPREREGRRVIDSSLKRSGAVLKNKYAPAQTNREMMKRPAFYDKSSYEAKRMKVIAQNYYEDANKALPKSNKEGAVKVTKKPVEPPSVEPTPEGHFELSPLLSKMVEVELQEVMKKVWELEPLDPKDEAEKLVCDRFKNKAGQGLRNTLGLNITKRLLNIYNPLYVKMVFGGKPPRAELMAFLKKHKISAFKSVSTRGVYAAKMRTCQDFDDLCNNNNLKCGKIRVTVTPCYQFMTCPTNLRTRYDCKNTHNYTEVATALTSQTETQEKVKTTKIVTTNVSPAKDNEANKSDVKTTSNNQSANNAALSTTNQGSTTKVDPKVTPGKTETQLKAEVTTPKVTPAKTENKPTVEVAEIKPQSNVAQNNPKPTAAKQTATAKTQIATPEPNVAAPNTVAKVTPSKPMPKTTPSKLTVASAKPAATNQNIPAKVTLAKTNNAAPNTNSAAKSTPAKPTVTQTQNSAPKVTQPTVKAVTTQPQDSATKVAAASPIATPKPIQNSTPVKKAAQNPNTSITTPKQNATQNSKIPNKPNANTKTPQTKPVVTAKTNTGKATSAKAANKTKVSPKAKVTPKKKQSDYDELDDHDILALISEGIVLDECSGSDME